MNSQPLVHVFKSNGCRIQQATVGAICRNENCLIHLRSILTTELAHWFSNKFVMCAHEVFAMYTINHSITESPTNQLVTLRK